MLGSWLSTARRNPEDSWKSSGRSKWRRAPVKYSSSSRATSSSRCGAFRIRGLMTLASAASTWSWSSLAKATRTSPAGVAASSSGPTGLSIVR